MKMFGTLVGKVVYGQETVLLSFRSDGVIHTFTKPCQKDLKIRCCQLSILPRLSLNRKRLRRILSRKRFVNQIH